LGLVDPDQLDLALRTRATLTARAELRHLVELLRSGCRSELEVMGFIGVFSDPRLPVAHRQVEVIVGDRRYVLDVAWPELLLAVELDGAAYHGSTDARESDVRRDSALAGLGWLTIRITYERLVREPAAVIEELLDIIAARRGQLGLAA
jgi:very-short-patch-repair endonuclease